MNRLPDRFAIRSYEQNRIITTEARGRERFSGRRVLKNHSFDSLLKNGHIEVDEHISLLHFSLTAVACIRIRLSHKYKSNPKRQADTNARNLPTPCPRASVVKSLCYESGIRPKMRHGTLRHRPDVASPSPCTRQCQPALAADPRSALDDPSSRDSEL